MRKDTFKMREKGCQMRHFRAIAQDLAALHLRLYVVTEIYATFIIISIGATPPSNITKNRKPNRKIYEQDRLDEYFFSFQPTYCRKT